VPFFSSFAESGPVIIRGHDLVVGAVRASLLFLGFRALG
jgi:hypothetical protein